MRRLAGAVAALLIGFIVISSGALAQSDWRPRFDHGAVAEGDARLDELLQELADAKDDQASLDGWFVVLDYVEERYELGGDFHLEVLGYAVGSANYIDAFNRYDVVITRKFEQVLPLIEKRFGPEDNRVRDMRERLAWRYQGQGRIEEAKALVGPDHRMFGRVEVEGELDAMGNEIPPQLQTLVEEAKGLSGDALIANLKRQSEIRVADNVLMFSTAFTEIAIANELARTGRRDEAIAHLEVVVDDRQKSFMDLRLLVGQHLAYYLEGAGRLEEARLWLDSLEAEYGDITPDSLWPKAGGLDIIEPAYRMPQTNAQRARVYLQGSADPGEALRSARYTAEYLRLIQQTPSFGQDFEEEIARSREAPEDEPFGQDARAIFSHLVEAAWRVAQTRPEESDALREEAFGAAQDASSSSATAAIARTAAETAAQNAGLNALAEERRAVEAQLEQAIVSLDAYPPGDPEGDELANQYRRLLARQAEIDLELLGAAPEFFQLIRPKALPLADTQALLNAGEALLLIAPSEHATHVFAITPDDVVWHRSDKTALDIAEYVEFLRLDLDPWGSGLDAWDGGFAMEQAHALYAELIEPLEGSLKGVDTILYAADGPLATVPLTILLTEPPADPDARLADFSSLPWLGDRYAFSQLPSLASLAYLRRGESKTQQASRALTGFGDPLLEGRAARRGARSGAGVGKVKLEGKSSDALADVLRLRKMARLPGTATELEALSASLDDPSGATILREAATESAVKSADLASARFVVFATHGLLAGEAGEDTEPGLVFTPPQTASAADDGLLSASEILALKLAADWVILSACNTAAGDGLGEEALSGLARAFFYAGARSLMASHWPVSDDAAPVLTPGAVEALMADPSVSRAQALQRAMRTARTSPAIPNAGHPSNWAAFINIGDPR